MAVTPTSIRDMFPALTNPPYTDAALQPWIDVGVMMVDPLRWGALTDFGITLFAAHNAFLGLGAGASSAGGGGVVTDKKVDKVSISYDVSAGLIEGAGHWNLSPYGVRFLEYSRMAGAGPIQVSPSLYGAAGWPSGVLWR